MTERLNELFAAVVSARLALLNAQLALERAKDAWEAADVAALLADQPMPDAETRAVEQARLREIEARARYEIALLAYQHQRFLMMRERT